MAQVKAILFDMDGLMFDTECLASDFWKQAGAEAGVAISEEFLIYSRGSRSREMERLFYRCHGEHADFKGIRRRKRELLIHYLDTHEIPVKPGLYTLLEWLKKHHYKIWLTTSTESSRALRYVESAGVKDYFDGFVCGDMVEHAKPEPEIFLRAADAAGVLPSECVVLEDSFNGIRAAIDGGFIPVMVPDLMQPTQELLLKLAAKPETLEGVIAFLERRI